MMTPPWLVDLFEHSSLSTIAISLFLMMIGASILGFIIRRIPGMVIAKNERESGQESYVVSAVIGLLALLMAFTFALALDRYEDRRTLVIAEANALGTAYLRTQLLDEPHRENVSKTLTDYVDNRLVLAEASGDELKTLAARNDELIVDLWAGVMKAFPTIRGSPFSSPYISSINDVIDLDTSRKQARNANVPSTVYASLTAFILLSAVVVGYVLTGFWNRVAAVFLFLLLTISLVLIVDIDRPLDGSLRENQDAIISLQKFMRENTPDALSRRAMK